MNPKDTVLAAIALFTSSHDGTPTDLVGVDYLEHLDVPGDPHGAATGPSGFSAGTRYDVVRTIVEGPLVVTHGLITAPGLPAQVGIDLWRVHDGRLEERWSSRAPQVDQTASGRSQTDGPTAPDPTADSAVSKRVVSDWAQAVLLDGDLAAASRYLSEQSYAQHNPEVTDGIDGFRAAVMRLASMGLSFDYKSIDITIGEGDLVFTRGTGRLGPEVVFNDLWRVAGGRIVEHWDVVAPVRAPLPAAAATAAP